MRTTNELVWILNGQSPDRIAMARLSEYMQQLATMLGQTENVHFARIEKGSTRVVAHVDCGTPAQKVRARISNIRRGRAPKDAMGAYSRINEMLSTDNGTARLTERHITVVHFSGARANTDQNVTLVDSGAITGQLYALSEDRLGEVKARVRPRVGNAVICTADKIIGRELRRYLFEPVRVHGQGVWIRANPGEWSCQSLHIRDVRPVEDVKLKDAIKALREIDIEWPDDPLDDLDERGGAA